MYGTGRHLQTGLRPYTNLQSVTALDQVACWNAPIATVRPAASRDGPEFVTCAGGSRAQMTGTTLPKKY